MTQKSCHEYIEALSKATTVEELHAICSKLCADYGFDQFLYGAQIPTSFVKPCFIYISSYSTEWRTRYETEGYICIDPTVGHCASRLTPITWDKISPLEKGSKDVRQFMSDAQDFGIYGGVSCPVHSGQGEVAMLSLASSENQQKAQSRILEALPHAQLFTAYLHEAVRRIFDLKEQSPQNSHLTDREKECLLWAAEGKTTWETSQILGISERTVIFHVQNASGKLNVVNRSQAVARAVSNGIITPLFD